MYYTLLKQKVISFFDSEKAGKDPKRNPSTLLTNAAKFPKWKYPDFDPPSTGEIIYLLCQRWRQENYFRYSKHEERLDYNPEYGTKEREEPLTKANTQKKALKQKIDKLNVKMVSRLKKSRKQDKQLGDV